MTFNQIYEFIEGSSIISGIIVAILPGMLFWVFKYIKNNKMDKVLKYTEEKLYFSLNVVPIMESALLTWEYEKIGNTYMIKNMQIMCGKCRYILDKDKISVGRIDFYCPICQTPEVVLLKDCYKYEKIIVETIYTNIKKINKKANIY